MTLAVASFAALSLRPRTEATQAHAPARIVLLRPCAGAEDYLKETLLSSRALGRVARIRFLLASEDDGAFPIASDVSATLQAEGIDAHVLITRASQGNRKANQLAAAERTLPPSDPCVIVVADADVLLAPGLLAQLLGPLKTFSVGATWAPPREVAARTLGDLASKSILDASLHAFPLLAQLDTKGMVGKCFAIRSDLLRDIGGFAHVSRVLGEDMELSRTLHAEGYRTEATCGSADSLAAGRTFRAALQRYARWIAVIRHQRPSLLLSYPLLFAAAPLQFALALGIAVHAPVRGVVLAGVVVVVRAFIGVVARKKSGLNLRGLFVGACLADLVLLAAWVMVLLGVPLRWRGVPLRFAADGQLREEVRP